MQPAQFIILDVLLMERLTVYMISHRPCLGCKCKKCSNGPCFEI